MKFSREIKIFSFIEVLNGEKKLKIETIRSSPRTESTLIYRFYLLKLICMEISQLQIIIALEICLRLFVFFFLKTVQFFILCTITLSQPICDLIFLSMLKLSVQIEQYSNK